LFDERKFKAAMALAGVSQKELAQTMGIDVSTLYRKVKADGDFSRGEINTIIKVLHIENPEDIFFADELA
jgi:DNA-binding XRE family transcriptional regulator